MLFYFMILYDNMWLHCVALRYVDFIFAVDPLVCSPLSIIHFNYLFLVSIVVAAIGDSSAYSCMTTPANIPDMVVVAGVDPVGNVMLPWSNFGECVSVKAPGLLTSSAAPGLWASSSPIVRTHPARGLEVRRAGSAGAAAVVTGLLLLLGDSIDAEEAVTKAASSVKRRTIVNFIKNGSMLHYQMYNDATIHKYPYVPCTLLEMGRDWNEEMQRLYATLKAIMGTTHVFNHFERVRKQFMESSKHNS
jgi:hypothetical protein